MTAKGEEEAEKETGKGAFVKGSVRPLADSISVEDVERAAKQVREAIDQHQQQLNDLKRFSDENKSLCEIVLQLPDSVSHPIIVPFGKAAFFPGKLIHTNEFLVLLGDNHFAERSAKQTVEILHRRSEFLDTKIASAKAEIADLEAESSFVTNTAEEAKAGLVEIREEYMGPRELQNSPASTSRITVAAVSSQPHGESNFGYASHVTASTSSNSSITVEDREHDLLMARLSELELAEAAAGDDNDDSEEEFSDDSNAGVCMPFQSSVQKNVVSRNEHDLVEGDYDSEETEEDDGQLGNSNSEEDFDEADQKSSEEDTSTEDDQTWDLGNKLVPGESLRGKPLSRFAREVYSEKGILNSQHARQRVTFQQEQSMERSAANQIPSRKLENAEAMQGVNHVYSEKAILNSQHARRRVTFQQEQSMERSAANQIPSRKLENAEAMQGVNHLRKDQDWRRDGEYQKGNELAERLADKTKRDQSSIREYSRVQTSGEPAAAQPKAFTGKVSERSYAEPTSSNGEQL